MVFHNAVLIEREEILELVLILKVGKIDLISGLSYQSLSVRRDRKLVTLKCLHLLEDKI